MSRKEKSDDDSRQHSAEGEELRGADGGTDRGGGFGRSERHCSVCKLYLDPSDDASQADGDVTGSTSTNGDEPIKTLSCGHRAHEYCLRGWVLVGKRDSCPLCSEKVNLSSVVGTSPWARMSLLWAQLLETTRFMLVWNPLVVMVVHGLLFLAESTHTHEHTH